MIYLDHAATTPMRPGVWESMTPYAADVFGNSSGVHEVSRRAKNSLEEARERIAVLLGARPMEIVFTSGGTESDNLALKGAAWSPQQRSGVVTVATEHEAVLETVDLLDRFDTPVSVVGVDREGAVDLDGLLEAIDDSTAVVSVMAINNETGVIQDVAQIAGLIKASHPEVLVHSDAVQAFGSEVVDVDALGVDMLTITGHKFGGPKGAGLLYVREGTALEPLLHGGGQELGRRSGTHDVASAVGLTTAMELAVGDRERFRSEVRQARNQFEKHVIAGIEGAVLNTPSENRSVHHLNLRIPGVRNETLLMRLDQMEVAASAGSACQSGAAKVSHVLEAMGLSAAEARESLRFSFGWTSTVDEAIDAAAIVVDLVERLR
ncbi:MAG: cysteine desulfurase family protein [Actinomycetota bacterium]|nr:cysteine desulfurase family protein [Actinomycetota bacterium]